MLDLFIKWHGNVLKEDNQQVVEMAKQQIEFLWELKERRESDLKPCDKFMGASPDEQFAHLSSEYQEVRNEWADWVGTRNTNPEEALTYFENLIEELVDLQMSCETMLAILGLDEQARCEARKKVIEKNNERGYYGE